MCGSPRNVYTPVALRPFTGLCRHQHHQFEDGLLPQKEACALEWSPKTPPSLALRSSQPPRLCGLARSQLFLVRRSGDCVGLRACAWHLAPSVRGVLVFHFMFLLKTPIAGCVRCQGCQAGWLNAGRPPHSLEAGRPATRRLGLAPLPAWLLGCRRPPSRCVLTCSPFGLCVLVALLTRTAVPRGSGHPCGLVWRS